MKKLLFLAFLCFGFLFQTKAQTLSTNTQPAIWLRADIAGNNPNHWRSYNSGIHHGLTYGNIGMPDTCVFNFSKAFVIDINRPPFKVSDFLPGYNDRYTIITVYQLTDTNTEYGIWNIKLDSSKNVKLSNRKTKNIRNYIRYSQNGSQEAIINSSSQSWSRINVDSNICNFTFAGTDSFPFEGKFAEMIVFNDRLKKIDNEKVHTYLSLKYGIGIYFLNYVNSEDKILWNTESDTIYKYDIIGLGRDDSLGIYQKQTSAQGGNSPLAMYFNNIKYYNTQNNTQIPNMNFALYGNNGDSVNKFDIDTINYFAFPSLMKRKWKIKLDGSDIRQKDFNIKMHSPNIDSNLTLYLVVNRLADGDFSPALCDIIEPSQTDSNGNYYYNGINWDTDFSGEDMFTFSQLPISGGENQRLSANNNDGDNNNTGDENNLSEQSLKYQLYPNPTNGNFVLEITAANKSPFIFTIYDSSSKKIKEEEYSGNLFYKIEDELLNSGTYLLNLSSPMINKSIKLIVK